MKRTRPFLRFLLAVAVLGSLLIGSAIAFLQSNWIARHLRQALIDGVYEATGARAEIPGFEWNWRTLTIEMRGFTMHGFEPLSGPPLLTAPVARVQLRILSLLDGNVQLSSLVVTKPRFYLTVGPNGSTNIPGPKHVISPHEVIGTLLNLQLPHVEAIQGFAQINARSIPIDLVGDHVALLIQYQGADRRYHIALHSPALRLGDGRSTYFNGAVETSGELWRDHFSLTSSRFHSNSADIRLTGSVYEFNHPVLDWHLASTFATTETLRDLGIQSIAGGSVTLNGIGHHDPQTPFFFSGTLAADHLSAALPRLPLQNGSIRSKLLVDTAGLELSELAVSTPQGRFEGRATLAPSRDLKLSGTLSRIDLQTNASVFVHKPFPWSASLGGPIELTANLRPRLSNLLIRGALNLTPRPDGIPVEGDVHYVFRQQDDYLAIQESHIRLPNSQLTVSGNPAADVQFAFDSTNLNDINPGLSLFEGPIDRLSAPSLAAGGSAHLGGTAHLAALALAKIDGTLDLTRLQWRGAQVDHARSQFSASPTGLQISALSLQSPLLQGNASARVALSGWHLTPDSALRASGFFSRANVQSLLHLVNPQALRQLSAGSASGTFELNGTPRTPGGTAQLSFSNVTFVTEHLDSAAAILKLSGNQLTVSRGQIQSGNASVLFSGLYSNVYSNVYSSGDSPQNETRDPTRTHPPPNGDSPQKHSIGVASRGDSPYDHYDQFLIDHWRRGTLQLTIDTNRFPLSRLRSFAPALQFLDGQTELHLRTTVAVAPSHLSPLDLKGNASLRSILLNGVSLGDLTASASTQGSLIKGALSGNIRGSKITGSTDLQIAPGTPARGRIGFDTLTLQTLASIFHPAQSSPSLLSGSGRGDLLFDGPLEAPGKLHAIVELHDLQVNAPPVHDLGETLSIGTAAAKVSSEMILHSTSPVTLELNNGLVTVRSAQLTGRDTQLSVAGTAELLGARALHLALNGGIDLRLLQLLYPALQVGGQSKIAAAVTGTLTGPQLSGSIQLSNASVFSPLAPNGLSDLSGTVRFDQHRATLEKITAHTGGGLVSFGGFVTYSANHPLVYRLDSSGQNVRVRYANGISVTGNTQFSLTGTSDQSLLSGGITVSRVVLNPSADLGNLLSLTSAPTVAVDNTRDYLSHLQMDIHVESAPDLQLDTALSTGVQAEIDLQLRGTPRQPVFLGSIEANQGDIKVFGSRYSINRGQISFTNSVRLEPVLDLDLQTQARGITVDITISGTLNKLNINYRSDPPLQPRDIIALLTVGRAPQTTASESNVQSTNDANSLQSGANSVLGQAISPVSNRLSKLFGITNIKIDPLVQGVTNTPQARLTLEQQISRQITVTYITNLSQTSEQIFRLEYSLNPQFSLIALRDDNGEFGIDILYKKRFK